MLTAKSSLGNADACECAYGFSEMSLEDISYSIFPSTIASTISLVFLSETNLAVATGPLILCAPCSNCFTSSLDVSYRWEVTCVAGCTCSLHSTVQRNHHQKLLSSQMDISLLAQKFLLPKENYLSLIFTLRG